MPDELTVRERQVLVLIAAGKSTKQLAAELGIAFKTACCHRARILNKLDAHNTADLLRNASERGLIHWYSGQSLIPPAGPSRARVPSPLEERRKEREALTSALAQYRLLRKELRETRAQMRVALDNVLDKARSLVSDGTRKDPQLTPNMPSGATGLHRRGPQDVHLVGSNGSISMSREVWRRAVQERLAENDAHD